MTRPLDPMMPPRAPLDLAPQRFDRADTPVHSLPRRRLRDLAWRVGAFGPAIAITLSLIVGLVRWFDTGGFTWGEALATLLIGLTFVWVSLSVSAVVMAVIRLWLGRGREARARGPEQKIALLVPVYNETPSDVMGNVAAMRRELERGRRRDSYAFFILSDTQDSEIAAEEWRAVQHLRAEEARQIDVYYRRRNANTDKKVGNINGWIAEYGAAWDAMIVLDADSLMTGAAIRRLSDALARDPDAGLIQSFPVLISAETLFGRMQQFATSVYGWLAAEGLSIWSQKEGNYWGHNAIIRTRAFAASAQLPHLPGRNGQSELILSHDFVEAGMLRRAGWSVRFLPHAGGSFEETPASLIDYVLRDRRWCRGNLQHLRLLAARGFHPITRFHLLQGAFAYLLSPAWFALLVLWSAFLPMSAVEPSYFSPANPFYPVWPTVSRIDGVWFLAFIYTMLLLPKIVAAALLAASPGVVRLYGGIGRFAATTCVEIALAILYAPILMVQQSLAVLASFSGKAATWAPQARGTQRHSWPVLLRFHAAETVLGIVMIAGMAAGVLSLWLAPVALSLAFATVLSRLSSLEVSKLRFRPLRLDTPLSLREPRVQMHARAERARLRAALDAPEAAPMAAE
ncbi:Glucans biosynthesis glucosyltransferase H [Roseivivax sp. THAF40]|uniref:glucans biosynthesis glucosyltransferase MdoH n=1 Tax=unclassified Roseivivax TaxID=2639302 RepID=UPI001268C7B2|nr:MULTISPECIES: glucans biosynthesis glucosyltransferase MdoH [unclassified Roseivivax]QFS83481.1 Glucans biosynthesis glucosyltransferase H [Roseivivax sp. THAF197b]QFT47226.1 Glucans biosynthesis glucosyltransferase H [Roseivivax sp. THAF40]